PQKIVRARKIRHVDGHMVPVVSGQGLPGLPKAQRLIAPYFDASDLLTVIDFDRGRCIQNLDIKVHDGLRRIGGNQKFYVRYAKSHVAESRIRGIAAEFVTPRATA